MSRTNRIPLLLGAITILGAAGVAAQAADDADRRSRGFARVEAIMQMRDRLELTEDQLATLDEIRRAEVERRTADAAELAEVRSQLAAGQIRRSELMAFMEERRDARTGTANEVRERVDGVLSEAQLEELQEMRGQARAYARGRSEARRGDRRAFRGDRPGLRGGRGGLRGDRSDLRRGRPGVRDRAPGARGLRGWRGPDPGSESSPTGVEAPPPA